MLDLLVRNGMIIDGPGNTGFYGAMGVEGEHVRILRGDLAGIEAARVIDAQGYIVCPGFIDMHAHSGLVMLAEPYHEPKVRQGVTTELIGVDVILAARQPRAPHHVCGQMSRRRAPRRM